ncbi:MAG: polyhydroxyalkanoic acid system family protein [Candidatus Competibacteraceae bacterium]|nr:polyhydroxyalkanoic acid system family protein [Candidatus Competibacteraceae bacterium]MCB1920176.1 polyhydroxyalkanoic acid system family protein [Candidatus Competibacteraceae bacterium]MCP5127879.1 polyhydroxyalkanoic acid system family protein [Gammaproteobacteria bacterium]HRX71979.1 polyhydroxyalkanoic acid system family protein [Candidatus Competibacteraceae bacterium]
MSHIVMHRDHPLTLDQAREAAETIAAQLADRYAISHHWQDDSLYFERSGISGQIDLEPGAIRISIRLGFLLAPFKHQLEQQIQQELDAMFGAAPDGV